MLLVELFHLKLFTFRGDIVSEVERVVVEDSGDSGYFKDPVARQDIKALKLIIEDLSNVNEATRSEATETYNTLYKEIFG